MIYEGKKEKNSYSYKVNSRNYFENSRINDNKYNNYSNNSNLKNETKEIKNMINYCKKTEKKISLRLLKEENYSSLKKNSINNENDPNQINIFKTTFKNYNENSKKTINDLNKKKKFILISKNNFSQTENLKRKKNIIITPQEKKIFNSNIINNNSNNNLNCTLTGIDKNSNSKNTFSITSNNNFSSSNSNKTNFSNGYSNKNEPSSFFYLSNSKSCEKENKNEQKTNSNESNDNNIKNINNKTITTSVNSSLNNVSSFGITKSSFKNSSISNPKNNSNIIFNSLNLKNAISNTELNNKDNKKTIINLISVSNSEKRLLIPEYYDVQKPYIQNSYMSFNKNNFENNFFLTSSNRQTKQYEKIDFSLEKNNKNNKKKFQQILNDIIKSSEEIGKNIYLFSNNNKKSSKTFSKDFCMLDEKQKDFNSIKEILNDNLIRENFYHKLRLENIKYDNKLINILKNVNQPFIYDMIKSRNKMRKRNLEIKKKYFLNSIKYKIHDFGNFKVLENQNKKDYNKIRKAIKKNIDMMKYLEYKIRIDKKTIMQSYNNDNNKIDINEKIKKLKEYKRKKNQTIS